MEYGGVPAGLQAHGPASLLEAPYAGAPKGNRKALWLPSRVKDPCARWVPREAAEPFILLAPQKPPHPFRCCWQSVCPKGCRERPNSLGGRQTQPAQASVTMTRPLADICEQLLTKAARRDNRLPPWRKKACFSHRTAMALGSKDPAAQGPSTAGAAAVLRPRAAGGLSYQAFAQERGQMAFQPPLGNLCADRDAFPQPSSCPV